MTYKRVDSIQAEIVVALRQCGASVTILAAVGGGVPDLLIGWMGSNYLLELKSSEKSRLTPDEEVFFADWRGQCAIVHTPEEALQVLGALT